MNEKGLNLKIIFYLNTVAKFSILFGGMRGYR